MINAWTEALADAGRLHHQLATAFTVALCGSEAVKSDTAEVKHSQAFTAVFAYCLIAYFKNWAADKATIELRNELRHVLALI